MSAGTVALIGFAAMAAAFGLVRRTAAVTIVSVVAIVACVVVCAGATASNPASCALAIGGLVAWSVGLLLLRTMLVRSVSLTLLIAPAGARDEEAAAQIASRLDEALGHGLVEHSGDALRLTSRGQLIVRCAGITDRVLGRNR